jgi:RNA polymerase sigma-70 factor (ECF subfamily)
MRVALTSRAPAEVRQTAEGLVALARTGEEPAVRTLMQMHNRRLFRLARSVLRDDAEAEDVVQATYVQAFTGLTGFRGDAAFSTWLTRIALNEALGRVRRRRPTVELSDIETEQEAGRVLIFPHSPAPPSPEAEAARRQVREVLEQAIDQLPDSFRLVFVLRDVEGLSIEETAESLGVVAETVKTRLHRARKLMRAAVEKAISPSFSELFPVGGDHCARISDRVIAALRVRRSPA